LRLFRKWFTIASVLVRTLLQVVWLSSGYHLFHELFAYETNHVCFRKQNGGKMVGETDDINWLFKVAKFLNL